jgi:hypothetical protein
LLDKKDGPLIPKRNSVMELAALSIGALLFLTQFIPAVMILSSGRVRGWDKTKWVALCLAPYLFSQILDAISFFTISLSSSLQSMPTWFFYIQTAIPVILEIVSPWVIYYWFRRKTSQKK